MEGGLRRGAYGAERASGTPKLTGLAGARPSTIERTVERVLKERTSVKDVIEACGVPHSEVDAIIIDGTPADFARVLQRNSTVEIYPVDLTHESLCHALLQERHVTRFVADGHLGKLTRNLRLLGFDVVSPTPADDRQLLETMQRENRALLTRDRRLLMHAVVRNGFYPRSQDANEQTVEVLRRFEIFSLMAPFTRCSQCNGLLEEVAKEKIIENLEPLTRIYYEQFRRCQNCGKIYWRGSHFDKLCARIEEFRAKSAT
jgi:uncharacterized protein with PIN domain